LIKFFEDKKVPDVAQALKGEAKSKELSGLIEELSKDNKENESTVLRTFGITYS